MWKLANGFLFSGMILKNSKSFKKIHCLGSKKVVSSLTVALRCKVLFPYSTMIAITYVTAHF